MTTDLELIPVFKSTINNVNSRVVSARILHRFLEVKSEFDEWITNYIKNGSFVQNIDFVINYKFHQKEYHITLNMARYIIINEQSPKEKEIVDYLDECEKVLSEIDSIGINTISKMMDLFCPKSKGNSNDY